MAKRSYGGAHQKLRKELGALVQAGGVVCWRCGEDIQPGAPWDLGHDDLDRDQYRGPEHQRCNRAVKGREPNAPATMRYAPRGRTMTARTCEICGSTYSPSHSGQRTCGRVCGAELRRRNHPPIRRKPRPRRTRPLMCAVQFGRCERCDAPFAAKTRAKRFCSERCMRGLPDVHSCTDCGVAIETSRHKCDTCLAESALLARRRKRQKYRQSEAGRRQRREYERRRAQRKREGGGRVDGAAAA